MENKTKYWVRDGKFQVTPETWTAMRCVEGECCKRLIAHIWRVKG